MANLAALRDTEGGSMMALDEAGGFSGEQRGFFLDLAWGGSLFDEARRELVRLGEV